MDQKLTLKMESAVIDEAKEYAKANNQSLSKLIEGYLKSLIGRTKKNVVEEDISPYVQSMRTGVSLPADLDAKAAYRAMKDKKYSE